MWRGGGGFRGKKKVGLRRTKEGRVGMEKKEEKRGKRGSNDKGMKGKEG